MTEPGSDTHRPASFADSEQIPASQPLRAAAAKVGQNVLVVTVILAVLACITTALYSWGALAAAVLATGTGVALASITRVLMGWAMRDLSVLGGAIVLDYLAKAAVIVAVALGGRQLIQLDHRALGIVLLVIIISQSVAQIVTLMRAKIPTITPANKDHE